DAAVRGCSPEVPREVVGPVDADLAWAAVEFLQHVRSGARGKRERAAGGLGGQGEGLLDEELTLWSRRRWLAHDGQEPLFGTAVGVHGDQAGGEGYQDGPPGGWACGLARGNP